MELNVLQTEFWSIVVPPEWWAEREEDSIVIGDQDEVGTIEISTLVRDAGTFDESEVASIAADNAEQDYQFVPARAGQFRGVYAQWQDNESAVREWYLASGGMLLFVTYCCDLDNAGMDDAAVDEILDTLELEQSETPEGAATS
jgi:hypothetical protein